MIYFENEKIIIRDIVREDVVNLFNCWIDKELYLHDPRPLPKSSKELLEECKKFCFRFDNEIMSEDLEDRKYKYFIITNITGNFIGYVNLFSINKEKNQGEMGIVIGDKRYWKQGIAYTALNFVINYIFHNMKFDRVYIETGENNLPAINLFGKLNFIKCDEYLDEKFKFIVMEKIK